MNSLPSSRFPHYTFTSPSHNHCWSLNQLNWLTTSIHSGIIMPLYHTVYTYEKFVKNRLLLVAFCYICEWIECFKYQAIIHMLCLYIIFWCAFPSIYTYLYAVLIIESIDKRKTHTTHQHHTPCGRIIM